MTRKKSRRLPIVLLVILVLLLLVFLLGIVKNQGGSRLEDLSATDQAILTEYNTLYASLLQEDIWTGYALEDKTILAMPGSWGGGYLINPTQPVSGLFAKEIALPEDWDITVYRVAAVTPGLMAFRFEGSLNTIGKDYGPLWQPGVLCEVRRGLRHGALVQPALCLLPQHEAFHYYMQEGWPEGSRFSTEGLTDGDIALLEEEYDILCQVQAQLLSDHPDQTALEEAARPMWPSWTAAWPPTPTMSSRSWTWRPWRARPPMWASRPPAGWGMTLASCTSPTRRTCPWTRSSPSTRRGTWTRASWPTGLPYETGGLLCLLMDALAIPDWQAALNSQTPETRCPSTTSSRTGWKVKQENAGKQKELLPRIFYPLDGFPHPSLAEFRRPQPAESIPICFLHGHAPGKKLCSARECRLRRRGSGCHPLNLGWATGQAGSPTPPRRRPGPRKTALPGPTQISCFTELPGFWENRLPLLLLRS